MSRYWEILPWLGLLAVFLTLSFFSVIGGWSFAYVIKSATGMFTELDNESVKEIFHGFQKHPYELIFWHLIFMGATIFIVAKGIRGGIETATRWMMPWLFLLLLVFIVLGITHGAFAKAVTFLFNPDFSLITFPIMLAAIGQAFFSLNVGGGSMLTYAAYMPDDINLPRTALIITLVDTAIALFAGLAIFPFVFAYGLSPQVGPELLFVALSTAFGHLPLGATLGCVFFLLISIASITSSIALLETLVSRAEEIPGSKRPVMTLIIGSSAFILGLGTVFSFNIWEEFHPLALIPLFETKTVFGIIDYIVSQILAPLGAAGYAFFAGWILSKQLTKPELNFNHRWLYSLWRTSCCYIAPVAIFLIFIFNIAGPM